MKAKQLIKNVEIANSLLHQTGYDADNRFNFTVEVKYKDGPSILLRQSNENGRIGSPYFYTWKTFHKTLKEEYVDEIVAIVDNENLENKYNSFWESGKGYTIIFQVHHGRI